MLLPGRPGRNGYLMASCVCFRGPLFLRVSAECRRWSTVEMATRAPGRSHALWLNGVPRGGPGLSLLGTSVAPHPSPHPSPHPRLPQGRAEAQQAVGAVVCGDCLQHSEWGSQVNASWSFD